MKKNYDFSSVARQLFVNEHIGITDIGKFPVYEQELEDISVRYLHSLFFSPSDSSELRSELISVLAKYKPSTVSPYLKNYYL